MKFKKDEIIVCNTDDDANLTKGKEYKVNYVYENGVVLIEDDGKERANKDSCFDKKVYPKKGDWVECVDAKGYAYITIGSRYLLTKDSCGEAYYINNDINEKYYYRIKNFKVCYAPIVYPKKDSWVECVKDCNGEDLIKGKKYQLTNDSDEYNHHVTDDAGNERITDLNLLNPCEAPTELTDKETLDKIRELLK